MVVTALYGVPENFLNTTNSEFYLPKELEMGAITSYLPDGKPDCISALYNENEIEPWPSTSKDIYNITSGVQQESNYTQAITILLSANMGPLMSISANDTGKLITGWGTSGQITYRMKVRGLLTKLPGFYFTAYKNPLITPTSITSTAQVSTLLHDYWATHPRSKEYYDANVGPFNSTDGIPKQMLYVKLTESCTTE